MARRNYVFTLQKVAMALCKYIAVATPILQRQYPENATLQAALVAANTACGVLFEELEAVRVVGD